MAENDAEMMARALELGKKGDPSPNPHVGCVIVQGDTIVGEGFHNAAGGDHAEIVALAQAGDEAKGATLYVTLEPCNHTGRTGPCVDAVLEAGVARVVVGCKDPNPKLEESKGSERLIEGGVEVSFGVLEEEARALIKPWKTFIEKKICYVTLKLAMSLDGRIATRTGASKWITSKESRAKVHALRAAHDAVMVGINTILADDPELTVREIEGRDPIRVVVDSGLRIPADSHVVATAKDVPTCVITTNDAPEAAAEVLEASGVSVIRVTPTAEGRCDLAAALKALALREVVSVLCEGGAELAGTLLAGAIPSEMHVFIAPIMLGPRGRPGAVDWAGPETPGQAPRIAPPNWEQCGPDAYVSGPLSYPKKKVQSSPTSSS
ncbi:MAG: bifunctional diaminohydroxyphosphoribosylaminopyrimidine deaminase/5-amino-6-(5-phosphoribosylamino)uracil reductase RibD [Polyangiaceae bacterium]|nr:bifunctional diaminohydroxyphosphoribosylaminopyrimidine deaminase/5-amino-6-(5-phosphoribosylamino)uracil reductase RibD [Polyangiaceae bacterium]